MFKDRLIDAILNSRLGIRVRSSGPRFTIIWTRADGQTAQVSGLTEYQVNKRLVRDRNLQILDSKERVVFTHLDPKTGKYIKEPYLVDSWEEALEMRSKQERKLIRELLPFVNYIPHNRLRGTHWVRVFNSEDAELFSARVLNKTEADELARGLDEIFKKQGINARIEVKEHDFRIRQRIYMGSIVEVEHFLRQVGVDPTSEAGQRIVNAYREMSNLFSSLIHAENIPGYRVDYDGILEASLGRARSAINRNYRGGIRDLIPLTEDVKDTFNHNTAVRYLNLLSSVEPGNPILDAGMNIAYFSILANRPPYIVQNLSELIWGFARMPPLKHPLKFLLPMGKEWRFLIEKAQKEGVFGAFFGQMAGGRGLLYKFGLLGNWSENWSSQKNFELGLRIARDKGLPPGEEAYKFGYQFLLNVAKPFYSQANALIALLGRNWGIVRKYGFIFLHWVLDWINKTAFGGSRVLIKSILAWILIAGLGSFPKIGRWLIKKFKLVDYTKKPKDMSILERYILAGIPGMFYISPGFLVPFWAKGFRTIGDIFRSWRILQQKAERARRSAENYGPIGWTFELPLGGLQYPIAGITKTIKGFRTRRGKKTTTLYTPETLGEKIPAWIGFYPFALSEQFEQQRQKIGRATSQEVEGWVDKGDWLKIAQFLQFCLNYPDRISQKDLNLIIKKAFSAYGTAPKTARAMAQMILEKKKPSTKKGVSS